MSLKLYCLVIHISHKTLEIGCAQVSDSRAIMALLLAPLAKGQRAIVMALCPSSVRSSVRASVNFFFKKLLLRNY